MMPAIENVPWRWTAPDGRKTFYKGQNEPVAVVLHRMQGYATTARRWAADGHYGASWHYTVGLDGSIMQHLSHEDGGYHAGILDTAPSPTWPLWRGHGQNVNTYTLGVEAEGFEGDEWPAAQLESLRWLCRLLARELGIPYDREHFPPHADIDVVDRVNDFDTPERRHIVYDYLFAEAEMDPRLDAVIAALGGMAEIEAWNARGNSLLAGYALEQEKLGTHLGTPHGSGTAIATERIGEALTHGAKAAASYLANAAQKDNGG